MIGRPFDRRQRAALRTVHSRVELARQPEQLLHQSLLRRIRIHGLVDSIVGQLQPQPISRDIPANQAAVEIVSALTPCLLARSISAASFSPVTTSNSFRRIFGIQAVWCGLRVCSPIHESLSPAEHVPLPPADASSSSGSATYGSPSSASSAALCSARHSLCSLLISSAENTDIMSLNLPVQSKL